MENVGAEWIGSGAAGYMSQTEAYDTGEPAGHAYRGITTRNRALFPEHGPAHIHPAYGSSCMRTGFTCAANSLPRVYVRGNGFVSDPRTLNR